MKVNQISYRKLETGIFWPNKNLCEKKNNFFNALIIQENKLFQFK